MSHGCTLASRRAGNLGNSAGLDRLLLCSASAQLDESRHFLQPAPATEVLNSSTRVRKEMKADASRLFCFGVKAFGTCRIAGPTIARPVTATRKEKRSDPSPTCFGSLMPCALVREGRCQLRQNDPLPESFDCGGLLSRSSKF